MSIVVASVLICATLGYVIASRKGLNPVLGVLAGALFSVLGLVVLLLMRKVDQPVAPGPGPFA